MIKKRLLFLAAALATLLAACSRVPQPPMTFGGSVWPGYDPVYLAHDLGYFQGANLRLGSYPDAAAVENDFRSGKLQVAALPLERALLLRGEVPDVKIILLFSTGPGKRLDVLVTRDPVIGEYHHELQQLLQGWRKALDYVHAQPVKAVEAMARREGVTPEQYRTLSQGVELYTFERAQRDMIGEPPPVSSIIEAAQRDLLSRGKLSIGMDTSMLVDSTLLAEARK
jgi:ABC-type nitrate/sulfonate/bicarbonate transport system substrate-binding protein